MPVASTSPPAGRTERNRRQPGACERPDRTQSAAAGRRTPLSILLAQLASPLVLILVAASLVSLVLGDQVNAAIILPIVVLSVVIGFVQETRSEMLGSAHGSATGLLALPSELSVRLLSWL